jgi:NADH-quinone oxidoreductase subunit M
MNRLYLDALSMRLSRIVNDKLNRFDASPSFPYVAGLLALGLVTPVASRLTDLSLEHLALLVSAVFLLPLFPFQWGYIALVTRGSAYKAIVPAVLLPAAGLYALAHVTAEFPAEVFRSIGVLSLCGAVYASLKAWAQLRVPHLLAYSSIAFYSVFWRYFSFTGSSGALGVTYTIAVILTTGGLLLAWQQAQASCGRLTLDRVHGLARPMPRFATIISLLVMAAVGLPPFGLFSAFVGMLLHPATAANWGLIAILFTWFSISWHFFRMMQRLLFGPHQSECSYQDLRAGKTVAFAVVLLILLALGIMPNHSLVSNQFTDRHRRAMGLTQ